MKSAQKKTDFMEEVELNWVAFRQVKQRSERSFQARRSALTERRHLGGNQKATKKGRIHSGQEQKIKLDEEGKDRV